MQVVKVADDEDVLQLFIVKVRGPEGHHEVLQAHQGGQTVGEQTHHYVVCQLLRLLLRLQDGDGMEGCGLVGAGEIKGRER